MQLIASLRKDLAVEVDVTAIFLAPTARQLATVLRDKHGIVDEALPDELGPGQPDEVGPGQLDRFDERRGGCAPVTTPSSLVGLAEGPGEAPLFLIHAVGGTVYAYAALARELADIYDVWGIEADGLGEGTRPATSRAAMVSRYADAIRTAQPRGPYRLAGWSLGGLLALEVAERLIQLGGQVAFVGLLDAPMQIHEQVTESDDEVAAYYVADAARTLRPGAGAPLGPDAPKAEQLRWLAERLAAGADIEGVAADMERRFAVYRAHLEMIAGYVPPAVPVDVVVVGARESADNSEAWARALPGTVRSVQVPGDHYSFLGLPGAREVAAALRAAEPRGVAAGPKGAGAEDVAAGPRGTDSADELDLTVGDVVLQGTPVRPA